MSRNTESPTAPLRGAEQQPLAAAREALGQRQMLRGMLEQLPCGVIVADEDCNIRFLNERFRRQFGVVATAEALTDTRCDRLFSDLAGRFSEPKKFLRLASSLRDGREARSGMRLEFADGRSLSLDYASVTSPLGTHHLWLFHDISEHEATRRALARSNELLERVGKAFSHYVAGGDPRPLFDGLLADALALTESEYGFIGRVLVGADGAPYLKTYAITNIAWDDETRELFERHHRQGMEFHNLETLFGRVLSTREPVIANAPAEDPRRGGLPAGHPPLDAFLGIPLLVGERLVGMVGVANRPGGYDEEMLSFLQPFLAACANIIEAERAESLRRESEARFAELYRNLNDVFTLSPDGFLSIGHDDRVQMVSPGFTTLTGIPGNEIVGRDIASLDEALLQRADPAGAPATLKAMLSAPTADESAVEACSDTLELRFPRPRILQRQLRQSAAAESQVKAIVCLRDVTAATEVDRMKSEFLSTAAHELRTPMASVFGYSELLLTREFDESTSLEFLRTIHAQSGRLIEMLNELLDLARIEARAGKDFEMAPGWIDPLLETAVREFVPTVGNRRVTLEIADELPAAHFDRDKMMQVLTNILSNAVKYSPDVSGIRLCATARTDAEGRRWLAIAVEDQGIGMSEEEATRVFERFYRADPSGVVPGSGLGMSLVREIVDIHAGRIEIDSLPGEGTTVTILLPAIEPGEEPAAHAAA